MSLGYITLESLFKRPNTQNGFSTRKLTLPLIHKFSLPFKKNAHILALTHFCISGLFFRPFGFFLLHRCAYIGIRLKINLLTPKYLKITILETFLVHFLIVLFYIHCVHYKAKQLRGGHTRKVPKTQLFSYTFAFRPAQWSQRLFKLQLFFQIAVLFCTGRFLFSALIASCKSHLVSSTRVFLPFDL